MKYRLWILIAGILLVISGCTVISAKNYTKSLPLVMLTSTVPDSIRTEQKVTGNLYYKELARMKLPEGCRIQEVFAEEGVFVSEGDPILRVKVSDLQIVRLIKQLESERLLHVEKAGGTEGELAFWQRQSIEEDITFLEDLIAGGGIVCTLSAGYVIRQDYEVGDVTKQDTLVILGVAEGGCYLAWRMEPNQYWEYNAIYATIQEKKQEISSEKPVYEDNACLYTAQFPEMTECIHGQPVELQFLYVSEEYPAVLPKNCIHYEEDGSAYVYQVYQRSRNFGKESYVRKVGVTIEDREGNNVALKASLSGVVLGSSKGLGDMMAVAVIEE